MTNNNWENELSEDMTRGVFNDKNAKILSDYMTIVEKEYFDKRKKLTLEAIIDIYNCGYENYDDYLDKMRKRENQNTIDSIVVMPMIFDIDDFNFILEISKRHRGII